MVDRAAGPQPPAPEPPGGEGGVSRGAAPLWARAKPAQRRQAARKPAGVCISAPFAFPARRDAHQVIQHHRSPTTGSPPTPAFRSLVSNTEKGRPRRDRGRLRGHRLAGGFADFRAKVPDPRYEWHPGSGGAREWPDPSTRAGQGMDRGRCWLAGRPRTPRNCHTPRNLVALAKTRAVARLLARRHL